ncbi:hypothetical protein PoB_001213200 [Plakobranchus ocellatus]|uniref:Uncharacterized protein n=1 Tax=Plakobranchus ocellatus TaxID=259542 RepID=A0AAV3YU12_9GAST|nr:hypothetical protein PoB_001213200 [Plakobranchus ocellatus]
MRRVVITIVLPASHQDNLLSSWSFVVSCGQFIVCRPQVFKGWRRCWIMFAGSRRHNQIPEAEIYRLPQFSVAHVLTKCYLFSCLSPVSLLWPSVMTDRLCELCGAQANLKPIRLI